MKLITEIRVSGCRCPRANPLSLQTHFPHVFADGTLRDVFSVLPEFNGNLWSTVVLPGIVIDLPDLVLDSVFSLFRRRWLVTEKSTVAGAGDAEVFEHSGDGDAASGGMRSLHLGSHFRIDSGCQSFPRMPMAFFRTSRASWASRSSPFQAGDFLLFIGSIVAGAPVRQVSISVAVLFDPSGECAESDAKVSGALFLSEIGMLLHINNCVLFELFVVLLLFVHNGSSFWYRAICFGGISF